MEEPLIAQKAPYVQDEEAGDYWWCACGRSAKQPFCDGAHKGTDFRPVKITLEARKRMAWCGCKHSGHKPSCDGSHKEL
jgi:CDGSH-type Zn-finger protein